ncbi:MAG: hypothetical protein ACR2J7_06895 [Luteimonas sp.]
MPSPPEAGHRRRLQWPVSLAGGLLFASMAAAAQATDTPAADSVPVVMQRSGHAATDRWLLDVDDYAARYPEAFADELVRYFLVPRALVMEQLAVPGARPADLYYACALARISGRPCRSTLEAWQKREPGEGWASVAGRVGVTADPATAARVAQFLKDSYRRWARQRPAPELQAGDGDP